MQSYKGGGGESAESCWMVSRPSQQPSPPGPQGLTSEAPMPPCTPPWCSHRIAVGSCGTDGQRPHRHPLPLGFDITRRTRQPLVQLQDTAGCVTSTESSAFSPRRFVPTAHAPAWSLAHQCRALGAAVLEVLVGPTTCPSSSTGHTQTSSAGQRCWAHGSMGTLLVRGAGEATGPG